MTLSTQLAPKRRRHDGAASRAAPKMRWGRIWEAGAESMSSSGGGEMGGGDPGGGDPGGDAPGGGESGGDGERRASSHCSRCLCWNSRYPPEHRKHSS